MYSVGRQQGYKRLCVNARELNVYEIRKLGFFVVNVERYLTRCESRRELFDELLSKVIKSGPMTLRIAVSGFNGFCKSNNEGNRSCASSHSVFLVSARDDW